MSRFPFSDPPVALVTGCSSGFGLSTAVQLARTGHRVFASMRDTSRSLALLERAAAAGVHLAVVPLDVADPSSINAAVAQVEEQTGGVDVLVNNAGYGLGGFFEDLQLEELRRQMETNFFGLAAVTQRVLPWMRERAWGRVINISSMNGRAADPGVSAYAASKFAVEGLSESLRLELRPWGIHVALVEPGMFNTEIFNTNRQVAARAEDPTSPYHASSLRLEHVVERMLLGAPQDTGAVARAVSRAATARNPRLRYVVGRDARARIAVRSVLPWRVYERAVERVVGHGPQARSIR